MFVTIKNKFNTEVTLCSVGASIYDIKTIDRTNKSTSIVVTSLKKEEFASSTSYFGKTIGRTGGRISNKRFTLQGKNYEIISKDPNGLHGGDYGLSKMDFECIQQEEDLYTQVTFSYVSKDMESGYPGNLSLKVIYRLYKGENKLELKYQATTDKDTLLNLSNHTYFNLNAEMGADVLRHELMIKASKMEEIKNLLPKGIMDAKNIYSFKNSHEIGKYIYNPEIITNTNGYDYPYIFDKPGIENENIVLSDYVSGKKLSIYTTYPVVVMYTCNYCEDILVNSNRKLHQYDAVCLECMFHPNTINSNFLNKKKDILKAGSRYDETIIYKFGLIE